MSNLTRLFKVMVILFAICILVQVFLAGLALFWDSARWAGHSGFAIVLFVVSILILVISFIARLPRSLRIRSAVLFGMIILMAVSAKLPSGIGYLSALHPVLALIMFFGTVSLAQKTDVFIKAEQQSAEHLLKENQA